MKQLEKSDLKEGLIYKATNKDFYYIFKATKDLKNIMNVTGYNMFFKEGDFNGNFLQFFEVTSEEKHWLETCIKADKLVSYEESMKTFIPEYYEYVGETNVFGTEFIKGKTYKIVNKNNLEAVFNFIDEKGKANGWSGTNWKRFKPSTKEAYDAQFIVKEPEFVLPEKWCIRLNLENVDIVGKWFNENSQTHINDYNYMRIDKSATLYNILHFPTFNYLGLSKHGDINNQIQNDYTEITFEQFKKYVLKENTIVTEEPKVVLEEPKDKVLTYLIQSDITLIHSVECSEGGVYRIGDKITVFDKYSPNKGKVFTIHRFRWSNDKSKICAVTELHTPNGIGLDKIELYVEPKVKAKIVDDFVLPEKWCIKDVKEVKHFFENYNYGNYSCRNIAYLHYPKIKDYCYFETIQKDYTEITLEQFKKYVLNEKV